MTNFPDTVSNSTNDVKYIAISEKDVQLVNMTYLDLSESTLLERGALHTAREIAGQPALWLTTLEKFNRQSAAILSFLKTAIAESTQIVLTGAGTSAYIGLSLQGVFSSRLNKITAAIPTTDILSHPQHYFNAHEIPLVISFARSGKSPESCAALELADRFSKKCFHLIIIKLKIVLQNLKLAKIK